MTLKEIPATELMTMHVKGEIVITHLGDENAYWTDPWTGEEFYSKFLPTDAEVAADEAEYAARKAANDG